MPIKQIKRFLFGPPRLSREEAMKVFKRDHFKCQYCGLEGMQSLENWLILTIDHVHPHARGGAHSMNNLVTACQPCNLIKGKREYKTLEDAKKHVVAKREEWQQRYQSQLKAGAAAAH